MGSLGEDLGTNFGTHTGTTGMNKGALPAITSIQLLEGSVNCTVNFNYAVDNSGDFEAGMVFDYDGTPVTISSVTGDGTTKQLIYVLDTALPVGETVTCTYTASSGTIFGRVYNRLLPDQSETYSTGAGLIFYTGVESGLLIGTTQDNGFKFTDATDVTASTESPKSGLKSAKFIYHGNPDITDDEWSELRFELGDFYDDLWIKYDILVPTNYKHRMPNYPSESGSNNKLLRLFGVANDTSETEGPIMGLNVYGLDNNKRSKTYFSFSAYNGGIKTAGFEYNAIEEGKYNDGFNINDFGQYHTIIHHYKYASIANNDGVAEVWKIDPDGLKTKMINIQDGAWYGTRVDGTTPARGWDKGYLMGWSNSGFDSDTAIHIDNISFSETEGGLV